jgi:hypothetical protein
MATARTARRACRRRALHAPLTRSAPLRRSA